jgi:hypothetical protein
LHFYCWRVLNEHIEIAMTITTVSQGEKDPLKISAVVREIAEHLGRYMNPETSLATAATTSIGNARSVLLNLTGSTTVTAFDQAKPGTWRIIRAQDGFSLTYNSVSMITPTAANITFAAGDAALVQTPAGGLNWRVEAVWPAAEGAWTSLLSATKTTDYTVKNSDSGTLFSANSTGTITFTLPSSPTTNSIFRTQNIGSGTQNVLGNGNNIDGVSSVAIPTGFEGSWTYDGSSWKPIQATLPAMSAEPSTGTTTIAASTWTKVQSNTKRYDTDRAYDNVTNYRFQPTISGLYLIFAGANLTVGANGIGGSAIYKNGVNTAFTTSPPAGAAGNALLTVMTTLPLNGSSDYIEHFAFSTGASPSYFGSGNGTQMIICRLS